MEIDISYPGLRRNVIFLHENVSIAIFNPTKVESSGTMIPIWMLSEDIKAFNSM